MSVYQFTYFKGFVNLYYFLFTLSYLLKWLFSWPSIFCICIAINTLSMLKIQIFYLQLKLTNRCLRKTKIRIVSIRTRKLFKASWSALTLYQLGITPDYPTPQNNSVYTHTNTQLICSFQCCSFIPCNTLVINTSFIPSNTK